MIRILLTSLVALVAVGCSDRPEAALISPDASALDVSGQHGAQVFIAPQDCGMFDGNGGDVHGPAKVNVITRSPNGNALHNCHLPAPNDQGHAVRYTPYDNPLGVVFPCLILDGPYLDPETNVIETYNWSMTISAGGMGRLTCVAR